MTEVVLLRFDAPLVAFGAPVVDQNNVVQPFPGRSLLAGLFGNALGWEHRDHGNLARLQARIRFAARIDRSGQALVDYQTVDLGQPWMVPKQAGWTTRGEIATRDGGSSEGTHIRYRHHRADSVHTVAVDLLVGDGPSPEELAVALEAPSRPLFLGRKACLPAGPILLGRRSGVSALAALASVPRLSGRRKPDDGPLLAWWDEALGTDAPGVCGPFETVVVTDERDWRNQVHVGRRFLTHGRLDAPRSEGSG